MGEKYSKDGVFTRKDVIRIRKGIKAGTPTQVYADEFKVSMQCIYDLAYGDTHSDVNEFESPITEVSRKHLKAVKRKERVLELLKEGYTQADVMRITKLSEGYVSLIARGKR